MIKTVRSNESPRGKTTGYLKAKAFLGVGTELTRLTLEEVRELAFDSIWLTVENSNLIAIKLYRKFGFQFCDEDGRLG